MGQTSFQYEPLCDPDRHIRIAVLRPGWRFEDELRITFIIRELQVRTAPTEPCFLMLIITQVEKPAYEALSYVWGSEEDPSTVAIDLNRHSSVIAITRSLNVALRYLRYKCKPRSVWVDALCINQSDNYEKSIQVANMGQMFARARRTIAWLGSGQCGSSKGMELLREIARNIQVDPHLGTVTRSASPTIDSRIKSLLPTPKNRRRKRRVTHWAE